VLSVRCVRPKGITKIVVFAGIEGSVVVVCGRSEAK
jgi:hypothetical protein